MEALVGVKILRRIMGGSTMPVIRPPHYVRVPAV